jgi:hypothetical protein
MNRNTARRPIRRRATPRSAALLLLLCACTQILFAQQDSTSPNAARPDTTKPGSAKPDVARHDSAAAAGPKKPRPMSWKDIASWKYINTPNVMLSPDGKWLAWPLLTTEGDGELIIRLRATGKLRRREGYRRYGYAAIPHRRVGPAQLCFLGRRAVDRVQTVPGI